MRLGSPTRSPEPQSLRGRTFLFLAIRAGAPLREGGVRCPLKSGLAGRWSFSVNGNWRVTFEFRDGSSYVLDYEDYH
ncbi:hypothetical protein G3T37_08975 [Galbitalea soli]|uniref:Killer protein n=1 Tax=Galbitalea soli TaxID=1268042 RepID=A0A7C9PNK6_9MICO|nr:hypothetical protein [Galbitalea soli]